MPSAKMSTPMVMNRSEMDGKTLEEIAKACQLETDEIEEIYDCTPCQLSMIDQKRDEMFHFVVSFGPAADVEAFCNALKQTVAINPTLSTRLVRCNLGVVQVVTNKEHVLERQSGDLEEYLESKRDHLGLGTPLFYSAFIGRTFVATIHHAIMDYWSISALLNEDVPGLYNGGKEPVQHPHFKDFVKKALTINDTAAKDFWAPRFHGSPAIFPPANEPAAKANIVQRQGHMIELGNRIGPDGAVPHSRVPFYIEAAWALTSSIYTNSESVAYGYVMSGRSAHWEGLEETLGPTIVEVPIQVNMPRNKMTVDQLVRERSTSLRQLQANPDLLYCSLDQIGTLNEAAKSACEFKTLLNIRPGIRPILPNVEVESHTQTNVRFERMIWIGGLFPLQLICNIQPDGIEVEARYDTNVLELSFLERVLEQFGHITRILMDVPAQTKLANLPFLNEKDQAQLLALNTGLTRHESVLQYAKDVLDSGESSEPINDSVLQDCHIWVVDQNSTEQLTPLLGTGEVLLEAPTHVLEKYLKGANSFIPAPQWTSTFQTSKAGSTQFLRTKDLGNIDSGGAFSFLGNQANRVKLRGQIVQLEDIERMIAGCEKVQDVVVLNRISAGRTQLVGLVCLRDQELPSSETLRGVEIEHGNGAMNSVLEYVETKLPKSSIPDVWIPIEKMPRTKAGKVDRQAAKEWLRMKGKTL